MTDQAENLYIPSDKLIAEIRARVTGTCGCCGYDKHDFETADVLTLMDEVDRARDLLAHDIKFTFRPDYGLLNNEFSDDPAGREAIVLS